MRREVTVKQKAPEDERPKMRVLAMGPHGPSEVALTEGQRFRVGRAEDGEMVLNDYKVSRYHAELSLCQQGILVVDCGSTNGTYVDGVRVERAVVSPGAMLSIGATVFRVESKDAPTLVSAPMPETSWDRPKVETVAAVPTRANAQPPGLGPDVLLVPEPSLPFKEAREEVLREFERLYLKRLLDACHGNVSRAARVAGIARSYLNKMLQRHRSGAPLAGY